MVRKAKNRYEDLITYLRTSIKDFNPRSAFEFLLALISAQIDADCCLLIDKHKRILYRSPTLKETRFSQTILQKVLQQKRSCLIQDAIKDNDLKSRSSIIRNIFLTVICIILKDDNDKIIGALYLDRHFPEKDPFTNIDLEKAEEFMRDFSSIIMSEGKEKQELNRFREDQGFEGIIGKSKQMLILREGVNKVAPTDSNVLLQGETGSGKELIARAIHKLSRRSGNPFIAINCAAIPKDLLESELFGHEKGSFTGATEKRKGKFLLAHNGTLFLDEIGDMDISLQTKLLRVLQEGEIQPLGCEKIINVNVRLITASSRNIIDEIKRGNFRKELYYRINSYPVFLPPLRERGDDIILLAEHFISIYCEKNYNYIPPPYFTNEAKHKLLSYTWEGNVRELRNIMENLSINCSEGELITDQQLIFYPIKNDGINNNISSSLKEIAEIAELEAVKNSLKKHKWNKSKVIKDLDTTYPTLMKIINKFGLDKDI